MSPGHLGRRAAAFREMKRTPQADASAAAAASAASVSLTTPTATSSVNPEAQAIVGSLPSTTVALAIVLSVLGLIIIGSKYLIYCKQDVY